MINTYLGLPFSLISFKHHLWIETSRRFMEIQISKPIFLTLSRNVSSRYEHHKQHITSLQVDSHFLRERNPRIISESTWSDCRAIQDWSWFGSLRRRFIHSFSKSVVSNDPFQGPRRNMLPLLSVYWCHPPNVLLLLLILFLLNDP